jgi:hypothetical protein
MKNIIALNISSFVIEEKLNIYSEFFLIFDKINKLIDDIIKLKNPIK